MHTRTAAQHGCDSRLHPISPLWAWLMVTSVFGCPFFLSFLFFLLAFLPVSHLLSIYSTSGPVLGAGHCKTDRVPTLVGLTFFMELYVRKCGVFILFFLQEAFPDCIQCLLIDR